MENSQHLLRILKDSNKEELLEYLKKCLFSEFQLLSNSIRPRIWNFLLLGKNEAPQLYICVRELNTALNCLSNTVKEQIWLDVSRLRPNLPLFQQNQVRVTAFCMLCLFCYQREISYFQGLHEILAPFIFLFQHEVLKEDDLNWFSFQDCQVPQVAVCSPLWKSYPLFCGFLECFAPFLLEKSEEMLIILLKRAFYYFQTLLLYHSPRLFWTLTEAEITPDMYCISWFVTLFARNLQVEELLVLYDCLLVSCNAMSIFYFALELMTRHESILLQVKLAVLPETLMNITVSGNYQVYETWLGGQRKQSITPVSFHRRFYQAMYETKDYSKELTTNIDSFVQLVVSDWLEEGNQIPKDDSPNLPFFLWDCRSKEEFDAGHLAIAARIPWESFGVGEERNSALYQSRQVLSQAVELFEPLRNIVRICLIGSGDDVLDHIDVYPLALELTRSNFSYVSILSGGIHSILEWKQETLPLCFDWIDLDCKKQKLIEERRKASVIQSPYSVTPSSALFGWNSQPMLDIRQSFNRVFKLIRRGKTVLNSPSNMEEKTCLMETNTNNNDLTDSFLTSEDRRMVSKHWLDPPLRGDSCDSTSWKVWCERIPKIGSVVDLSREEWIVSLQLFYVQSWSASRKEWIHRIIGISEYYFVVLARDTLHSCYASIKTFRPLEDIHQVTTTTEENIVEIHLRACVKISDDIPWPWDRQDEKWVFKLDERQMNILVPLLKHPSG